MVLKIHDSYNNKYLYFHYENVPYPWNDLLLKPSNFKMLSLYESREKDRVEERVTEEVKEKRNESDERGVEKHIPCSLYDQICNEGLTDTKHFSYCLNSCCTYERSFPLKRNRLGESIDICFPLFLYLIKEKIRSL